MVFKGHRAQWLMLIALVLIVGLWSGWQGSRMGVRSVYAAPRHTSQISCTAAIGVPATECEALLTFYAATNGSGWTRSDNWTVELDVCSWYGLTCASGHVTRLELPANNLSGPLSDLSALSELSVLDLHSNLVGQALPASIGNLSKLTILDLHGNLLTGAIPGAIGNLTKLNRLRLDGNQLSLSLPTDLGKLNSLTVLWLQDNRFTGAIPTEMGNLSKLRELYLNGNQLGGPLPASLSRLSDLTYLNVAANNITGTIPSELGVMTNLRYLILIDNLLTGEVPSSLGRLSNLTRLSVDQNRLAGAIPSELGNLLKLTTLELNDNRLEGAFPAALGNLTALAHFTIDHNPQLGGAFPLTLTQLSNLGYFDFRDTAICIPQEGAFTNWLTSIPQLFTNDNNCTTSLTPTMTPTPTPTDSTPAPSTTTPTATATATTTGAPAATATATATPTSTTTPATGDSYETDDSCEAGKVIASDGASQVHTFHAVADVDWMRFEATANTTYRVEVDIPEDSPADVNLEVYSNCAGALLDKFTESFTPGVRMDLSPTASGPLYLRLANYDATVAGTQVRYQVTVTALTDAPSQRALIIVAGRLHGTDRLQRNIHNVTNNVRSIFLKQGYREENIYYLATDSDLPGYSQALTQANLENAITVWAKERVQPNGVLTLYLIDHGKPDVLYLDDLVGEQLTPDELNAMLDTLEADVPGVKINVIIEACQSGSFISAPQSISKEGRVIITSTDETFDAKASKDGAYFSDHLLTSLAQGYNLAASFGEAQQVARKAYAFQSAWLDANGNGVANEFADATLSAQRGFAYADTLGELWPPHIFSAQAPPAITDYSGMISADIRDDKKVDQVWAVVYPPDYTPPATAQELQAELLPNFILKATDEANHYAGIYTGFTQSGIYRIVIQAEDSDGLSARPLVIEVDNGSRLFLPLIMQ
ncbi:MAG: C13 family peptidase [Caldilineaceae bacterium]